MDREGHNRECLNKERVNKERRERIQVMSYGEPAYPALLQEISDPPKALYYIGDPGILKKRCVAVVGSRTTTTYGRNTARAIGRCLAQLDIPSVSGLASGIDSCAHEGTIDAMGQTVAVLGCGPDISYPLSSSDLQDAVAQQGLVLSEYEPGMAPRRYHFPRRNRIISGLSEVIIIVQARLRSGALITAELAEEQGRQLLAVPGNIDSQYNLGTNQLIRDGIAPLTSIEELPEILGLRKKPEKAAAERLSPTEYRVFEMLQKQGEMSVDEICRQLDVRPSYILPILTALELKGFTSSAAGKFFLANM